MNACCERLRNFTYSIASSDFVYHSAPKWERLGNHINILHETDAGPLGQRTTTGIFSGEFVALGAVALIWTIPLPVARR